MRLSILIYHRVLTAPDPLQPGVPTAAEFRRQMRWLGRWFRVLPLSEAVERLAAGRLPPRAAAVTFDDGYADNAEVALPVLTELGMPATFFIATGYLDGGCMWNDRIIEAVRSWPGPTLECPESGLAPLPVETHDERRQAIARLLPALKYLAPDRREDVAARLAEEAGGSPSLMMSVEQLRRLHFAGMTIGAHTVSHPILANLEPDRAQAEIRDSRAVLEDLLDAPVELFAYPNGVPERDYRWEHARMVREAGFRAAVSTAWGTAAPGADAFQLPRFTPWDRQPWRFTARLAAMRLKPGSAARAGAQAAG